MISPVSVSSFFLRTILFSVIITCITISTALAAQPYTNAAGLRIETGKDGNAGFSFKRFIADTYALEGMLLSDMKEGVELSGLFEYQSPITGISPQLYWFGGAGLHIGSWGEHDQFVAGIDGILGVEYKFDDIPLAISADWHPVYNFVTENEQKIWPMKFGATLRYLF